MKLIIALLIQLSIIVLPKMTLAAAPEYRYFGKFSRNPELYLRLEILPDNHLSAKVFRLTPSTDQIGTASVSIPLPGLLKIDFESPQINLEKQSMTFRRSLTGDADRWTSTTPTSPLGDILDCFARCDSALFEYKASDDTDRQQVIDIVNWNKYWNFEAGSIQIGFRRPEALAKAKARLSSTGFGTLHCGGAPIDLAEAPGKPIGEAAMPPGMRVVRCAVPFGMEVLALTTLNKPDIGVKARYQGTMLDTTLAYGIFPHKTVLDGDLTLLTAGSLAEKAKSTISTVLGDIQGLRTTVIARSKIVGISFIVTAEMHTSDKLPDGTALVENVDPCWVRSKLELLVFPRPEPSAPGGVVDVIAGEVIRTEMATSPKSNLPTSESYQAVSRILHGRDGEEIDTRLRDKILTIIVEKLKGSFWS